MGKRPVEETLAKVEETQKLLRDSIEQTKELAAASERLIKLHRRKLQADQGQPGA